MNREELTLKANKVGVPEHLIDGLVSYVVDRRPTGHCLRAVLENDLMEAFSRADIETAMGMKRICTFIYSYTPSICHGSPDKVNAWLSGAS